MRGNPRWEMMHPAPIQATFPANSAIDDKKKQQKTRTPSGGVIAQNTAADVKQTKNDSPHQSFKGTRVEYKTRWF